MLTRWLQDHFPAEQWLDVASKTGPFVMIRDLSEEQRRFCGAWHIPLPSGRYTLTEDEPISPQWEAVFQEEGITPEQMKLKDFRREMFFSKGERAAWCWAVGLEVQSSADDLHSGWQKLQLSFELPRGSYATLVVKRIAVG